MLLIIFTNVTVVGACVMYPLYRYVKRLERRRAAARDWSV